MLNVSYLNNTLPMLEAIASETWNFKDTTIVARPVPILKSIAVIREGGGGIEGSRPAAFIYPMPGGELVRIRLKGDNTLDYDKATVLPETHPVSVAYKINPNMEKLELKVSQEGKKGPLAKDVGIDVNWLRETLEAQVERCLQELKAKGLIP